MDINAAFPSKYVRACDLQGRDRTKTIANVIMEDVGDNEPKPVVHFNGTDKGLVLNKTNAGVIANLYGPNTDGWIGKPITLFPTQTDFQGKVVECIRVRMQAPPQQSPPSQNTAPAVDPAYSGTGYQDSHQPIADDDIPF